jgi:hypothetical protein
VPSLCHCQIEGKMPIIHLFGKAFNWQNCRENAQLSICLKKLSIGKIVGKMPIIHSFGKNFNWQNCRENAILYLFGKVFNWQIEGKLPSSP